MGNLGSRCPSGRDGFGGRGLRGRDELRGPVRPFRGTQATGTTISRVSVDARRPAQLIVTQGVVSSSCRSPRGANLGTGRKVSQSSGAVIEMEFSDCSDVSLSRSAPDCAADVSGKMIEIGEEVRLTNSEPKQILEYQLFGGCGYCEGLQEEVMIRKLIERGIRTVKCEYRLLLKHARIYLSGEESNNLLEDRICNFVLLKWDLKEIREPIGMD